MKHLLVVLLTGSTPALSAGIDGRWFADEYDAAYCSGPQMGADVTLKISKNVWSFPETTCDASATAGSVTLTCAGEGEKWTDKAYVALSGDTLNVTTDGVTVTYTRCPEK